MGRPIGVAWLYEQLEGAVKRELGLEEQLAAAEARVAEAEAETARFAFDAGKMTGKLMVELSALRRVAEAARTYMKQRTTAHRRDLRDALAAWDAARGQNEVNMTEERYERRSNEPTD